MKQRLIRWTALLSAVGLLLIPNFRYTTSAQTTAIKAANTLSSAEQDVLNEINQARLHPSEYVAYLEGLKPFFKGNEYTPKGLMTNEGWAAVEDAIRFLRAAKPQPALDLSQALCLAALAHVKDQSGTGATGHKGANEGLIEERLKPYGLWQGGIGENLSYGNQSARERVLTWLIDDGVASRGHRTRLLSGDYKVAGLSCGPHPQYVTMCVITLAGGFIESKTQSAADTQTKAAAPAQTQTQTPASTQTKTPASTETKTPTQSQKPKAKKTARRM